MHDQHPPTIVVIGDINADLSFGLPAFPQEGQDTQVQRLHWGSGGGGLNMAVAFAQLGARARLLGRVGTDPAAEVALQAARRAGVDLAWVQSDPALATGLCGVLVSPGGERSFLSFRGANQAYDLALPDQIEVQNASLLVISGYALLADPQRQAALRAASQAAALGIPCALDLCLPMVKAARAVITDLLPALWLLSLNADELRALAPGQDVQQALEHLIGAGVQTVAVKRGAQGCSVAHKRARVNMLPPIVSAIDTNACGDAFTAGFAWALFHGARLEDCAILGNLMGALTATRPGAADAIPERRVIRRGLDPSLRNLVPPDLMPDG